MRRLRTEDLQVSLEPPPHLPYSQTDHINEPSDVARLNARFRHKSAYRFCAAADRGANTEDTLPHSPEPDSLVSIWARSCLRREHCYEGESPIIVPTMTRLTERMM